MVLTGIGLAACYFLFAGQFSIQELMGASLTCSVAVSFAGIVRRTAERRLECTHCRRVCARLIPAIVAQTWVVAGVLSRAILRRPADTVGTLHRQPFRHGDDEATDAGHRALVTLARSVAPEEFVVDIPEQGGELLVHTLSRSRSVKDLEWPL